MTPTIAALPGGFGAGLGASIGASSHTTETVKTHLGLFLSQAPFGVYVVMARGSVGHIAPHVLVTVRVLGGLLWLLLFHFVAFDRNMFQSFAALHGKMRRDIIVSGALGAFGPIIFIWGLKWTTSVTAAAVDASSPAIAVGLTLLLKTEPMGLTNALCVALSLAGNFLVLQLHQAADAAETAAEHETREWNEIGALLCFISTVMAVVNMMWQRPIVRVLPAEDFTCYMLMVAAVFVSVFALHDLSAFAVLTQPQTRLAWGMIGYAMFLQGWMHSFFVSLSVKRSSPVMVSMYTTIVPGVSAALGYFWLGEAVSFVQVAGVVLVISSVFVSAWQFETVSNKSTEVEIKTV
jgi:drug/metabolite transporter (DMT)-like permease